MKAVLCGVVRCSMLICVGVCVDVCLCVYVRVFIWTCISKKTHNSLLNVELLQAYKHHSCFICNKLIIKFVKTLT